FRLCGLGLLALLLRARFRHGLVEPPRTPDFTPQRERLPELDPDDGPRLRAPLRLPHHAQDAVDAEHRLQGDVGHRYVPRFFSSSWSMITQSTGPPVRVLYVISPSGATVQPSSGRCALYRAASSSAEWTSKPWYVFMTSRTSRPGRHAARCTACHGAR